MPLHFFGTFIWPTKPVTKPLSKKPKIKKTYTVQTLHLKKKYRDALEKIIRFLKYLIEQTFLRPRLIVAYIINSTTD